MCRISSLAFPCNQALATSSGFSHIRGFADFLVCSFFFFVVAAIFETGSHCVGPTGLQFSVQGRWRMMLKS